MKEYRIIISGGGTGGHIYPALAIAGELKKRIPGCNLLFVGASGRMEMEKMPAAGYRIVGLPVTGFPRKPGFSYFVFLYHLLQSMVRARKIIREFCPDLAVGVGGYASGPLIRAAFSAGIPALIQEQNSYAGMTNKLLGKKAACICVAYEGMERFFPKEKIVFTGNPVRENLLTGESGHEEAYAFFNIPENRKVLLITGGSLGARSINDAVLHNLELIQNSGVSVIWQTGSYYFKEMVEKTKGRLPENISIHQFLNRMDLAYKAADLVIARAGAGTISELCLVGKPAILVPSPNVAEDHQTHNALALVKKKAAILVSDQKIKEELFPGAFGLIQNEGELRTMSEHIRKLARPDAAGKIADEAIKLIRV